jgi:hypothetical protein
VGKASSAMDKTTKGAWLLAQSKSLDAVTGAGAARRENVSYAGRIGRLYNLLRRNLVDEPNPTIDAAIVRDILSAKQYRPSTPGDRSQSFGRSRPKDDAEPRSQDDPPQHNPEGQAGAHREPSDMVAGLSKPVASTPAEPEIWLPPPGAVES